LFILHVSLLCAQNDGESVWSSILQSSNGNDSNDTLLMFCFITFMIINIESSVQAEKVIVRDCILGWTYIIAEVEVTRHI